MYLAPSGVSASYTSMADDPERRSEPKAAPAEVVLRDLSVMPALLAVRERSGERHCSLTSVEREYK
jgi:hypothetical protein